MATFPDRLKELRKSKGLTQKSLGEIIGLSERGIQNYELGNNKPTSDVLSNLADYFGITVDYLLGRTNYWFDPEGNIKSKVPPDITW